MTKLIIVLVGLPARGKSFISRKISNYLNWLNIANKSFNVGNRRRREVSGSPAHELFDPHNSEFVHKRDQIAMACLDDLLNYIIQIRNEVAIFDATNSTKKRRSMIMTHIEQFMEAKEFDDYNVLFLESICNDQDILEKNIRLKLDGPDYKNVNPDMGLEDFRKRLQNYEMCYEPVESSELVSNSIYQYIKIVNVVEFQSFNLNSSYSSILETFLQCLNISKKRIWLSTTNIPSIHENVVVYSSDKTHQAHRSIPSRPSHDEIHSLILDIETLSQDTLIQTKDDALISGLIQYFQETANDLNYEKLLCLSEDLTTLKAPSLTRTTTVSSTSQIATPTFESTNIWDSLNHNELVMRLELLR